MAQSILLRRIGACEALTASQLGQGEGFPRVVRVNARAHCSFPVPVPVPNLPFALAGPPSLITSPNRFTVCSSIVRRHSLSLFFFRRLHCTFIAGRRADTFLWLLLRWHQEIGGLQTRNTTFQGTTASPKPAIPTLRVSKSAVTDIAERVYS